MRTSDKGNAFTSAKNENWLAKGFYLTADNKHDHIGMFCTRKKSRQFFTNTYTAYCIIGYTHIAIA